ncbi:hypothetical protein [Chimaeribacter arupi]|uniref:hypothetical protein n=1 Tax=Chimaeribacter arupi TaxID=2060066 RepID=UPI000C79C911|nr:hypothetical protein [Chimaeribacter arupi]PLR33578.1 hypothetical protein CYR23_12440 [Chimaeribacter arupi]
MKKSVTAILTVGLILAVGGGVMKSRSDKAHKENDAYYSALMCVISQRQGTGHPADYYLAQFSTVIEKGNASYAFDHKALDEEEANRVIDAYRALTPAQKARFQADDDACRAGLAAALAAHH